MSKLAGSNSDAVCETQPVQHLLMLLVGWIGECGTKIPPSPGTTAVLGRTRTLASQAHGVVDVWVSVEYLLEHDRVLPVVAEVVRVANAVPRFRKQAIERRPSLITMPKFRIS